MSEQNENKSTDQAADPELDKLLNSKCVSTSTRYYSISVIENNCH